MPDPELACRAGQYCLVKTQISLGLVSKNLSVGVVQSLRFIKSELSKKGALLSKGRGATGKPHGAKARCAHAMKRQKRRNYVGQEAYRQELCPFRDEQFTLQAHLNFSKKKQPYSKYYA
ncbi:hypothetical protein HRM2_30210 [Desulforapulum autotrophicum HRM2]|uniref:Uncharacterized protein n=1 Tax=Desulforapulum autotrophicum (strain ATCC 43914 / DSM 3382 / VKM B-1955 / HRM2) TaxID=177437 RepID=C0QK78_DESAH|nr:hypothetical protein [Desulforapulum autotrophicum]ACN16104.1 hypothetical protein HRM2_30210 [Desulforapulum autotrophicum HRM2]